MHASNRPGIEARALLVHSRPRFWLYLAGPVAVGVAYGAPGPSAVLSVPALVLLGYFLIPGNLFLYGINDVFDAELDRANPKKDGRERRWTGDRTLVGVVLVAVGLGLLTFVVTPPIAWPYLAGFFVVGAAYSAPPRLKTIPGLDSAANGLYVLPGAAAYAALAGGHPPVAALVGGWLWTMAMHAFSAIPDVAPDRAAGVATIATALGPVGTLGYCLGCWTLAAAAFGVLDPRLGGLLAVYPIVAATIAIRGVAVRKAYWWFPVLNGGIGMLLTVGGLWRLAGGGLPG